MLQIGVIGAGRIGRTHIQSVQNHVRGANVRAVADPMCNAELTAWAEGFGIRRVGADYRALLQDPEIDAVMVCTPTPTHAEISIEAMRAGKHVFCEKPVAMDAKDIVRVAKAVRETGRKFQIGFMQGFDHNYAAMIRAAAEGRLGTLQLARITSRDPAPPPIEYVRGSGGIYLDMMIHDFDLARRFLCSEAVEVFAQGGCFIDERFAEAGDVDTAIAWLRMENGAMAVIDDARACAYGYDQRAEIFGTKGMVSAANDLPDAVTFAAEGGFTASKPIGFFLERFMNAYIAETNAFIRAIEEDADTEVGIEDAYRNHMIAVAAEKSRREGRSVRIDEVEREQGVCLADVK